MLALRASHPLGERNGHVDASCPDHGSRRARLPQLQRRVSATTRPREVVAFTATQIPFINDRRYPASLAGARYPDGIQIYDESELARLIRELDVDDVVFAYSDVEPRVRDAQGERGARGRRELRAARPRRHDAEGHGPGRSRSARCARASGKSQTTRAIAGALKEAGKTRRRGPPPDAVRRPRGAARAALRDARGPRPLRLHDRGARGVRAAHHDAARSIYAGVDYGDDPRAGAGRVRRAAVGRREQRPALLPPDVCDHARRPAAAGPRAHATTPARPTCAWPT